MSTISPTTARRLAAQLRRRRGRLPRLPRLRRAPRRRGRDPGDLGRRPGGGDGAGPARPRACWAGRRVRQCGAVGAGLAVKLANNFLGAVNAAATAEALALAREAGVDPALVVEARVRRDRRQLAARQPVPPQGAPGRFRTRFPDHPHGEGSPDRRRGRRRGAASTSPSWPWPGARLDEASARSATTAITAPWPGSQAGNGGHDTVVFLSGSAAPARRPPGSSVAGASPHAGRGPVSTCPS